MFHVRAAIESKRDKDRTKEENHSSSSDSGYQPYSGAGSTITTSSTEATASRCSQSSALDSTTETSVSNKPGTERPTILLTLSSSLAQLASNSSHQKPHLRPLVALVKHVLIFDFLSSGASHCYDNGSSPRKRRNSPKQGSLATTLLRSIWKWL